MKMAHKSRQMSLRSGSGVKVPTWSLFEAIAKCNVIPVIVLHNNTSLLWNISHVRDNEFVLRL